MNWKKLLVVPLAAMLALPLTLTGCGGVITITEAGSTTVLPVIEAIAEVYMAEHTNIEVTTAGGGSGVGVTSAAEGTVGIGAASRAIKTSELEAHPDLVVHVLAYDGIAIVVHPDNDDVANLTLEQLKDIFAEDYTTWDEVGGTSTDAIVVVSREEGSGTRGAFEELVMESGETEKVIGEGAILQQSNGQVRTAVAGNVNAIGYLSFGYLDATVQAISVGGVAGTVANAKAGTYPIVRPLNLLTKGTPTGEVKNFIDYCLGTEGQEIVEDEGYLTVS